MAGRQGTTVRLEGLHLEIRPSVAFRELRLDDGVGFYLSLLDDEIDARAAQLLSRVAPRTSRRLADAAHELELTDAVVVCGRDRTTLVIRGGACCLPLFLRRGGVVQLTTALPVAGGDPLSRAGLVMAMAAACSPGSYEPNAFLETPLAHWRRVRRGAITMVDGEAGVVRERPIPEPAIADAGAATTAHVAEDVRAAIDAFGRSQTHVTSSLLELSGGFDSTIAGAAARSRSGTMRGVSVEYPYYEFRFEPAVQRAVADGLDIARDVIDGTLEFPYTPALSPPRFDEPTMFITGIRHAERVGEVAARHDAARIFVGHGGDQLFATDLTALEALPAALSAEPFSPSAWPSVSAALRLMRRPEWRQRTTGCFAYDAQQDVWAKETFGATVRTPFSDLALFRAANCWSAVCASRGMRPHKGILAQAVPELLPDAVTRRRGKVAYDGVWMRAYAANEGHISHTFERSSAVLEEIGVSPAWLIGRARSLADRRRVSAQEVLGAYAVASWLAAWGIERVSDVSWT